MAHYEVEAVVRVAVNAADVLDALEEAQFALGAVDYITTLNVEKLSDIDNPRVD